MSRKEAKDKRSRDKPRMNLVIKKRHWKQEKQLTERPPGIRRKHCHTRRERKECQDRRSGGKCNYINTERHEVKID